MHPNENKQYAVVSVRTGVVTSEDFHSILFLDNKAEAEAYVKEQIDNPLHCLDLSISIIEIAVYHNHANPRQFSVTAQKRKCLYHTTSTTE